MMAVRSKASQLHAMFYNHHSWPVLKYVDLSWQNVKW